jgi:hypothetical protein
MAIAAWDTFSLSLSCKIIAIKILAAASIGFLWSAMHSARNVMNLPLFNSHRNMPSNAGEEVAAVNSQI